MRKPTSHNDAEINATFLLKAYIFNFGPTAIRITEKASENFDKNLFLLSFFGKKPPTIQSFHKKHLVRFNPTSSHENNNQLPKKKLKTLQKQMTRNY